MTSNAPEHPCQKSKKTEGKDSLLEIADIFRKYQSLLGPMPSTHWKVVRDIINCRTATLGGHVLKCNNSQCDHQDISYNSCRNRHCSKCQFLAKAKWIDDRIDELLPVEYFHLVFTIPHEFNALALCNKKVFFNILFKAVSQTLKEVTANPDNLGAEVGFTAILHSWTQLLLEHFHIHIVIPGGGISFDGKKWINCRPGFFIPVKIFSKVFKGKFLDFLKKAYKSDKLIFPGKLASLKNEREFENLRYNARKLDWHVFSKKPFAGPKQIVEYLGNYTHRIAISNHRLIKIEDDKVYFWYRQNSKKKTHKSKRKIMVLHVREFMRRFLLHVLPPKFIRIRHYGFLGNRYRKDKIKLCKKLHKIELTEQLKEEQKSETWQETIQRLIGTDITLCPICKKGNMVKVGELKPHLFDKSVKERLWLNSS